MQNLKSALRNLARSPGFTGVAIATLALGIGLSASSFSMANAFLLRGVPYPESGELMRIFRTSPQSRTLPHSPGNMLDIRAVATSFSGFAIYNNDSYSLGEPAEQIMGFSATVDFLDVLRVKPALGRGFLPGEDQRDDQVAAPAAAPRLELRRRHPRLTLDCRWKDPRGLARRRINRFPNEQPEAITMKPHSLLTSAIAWIAVLVLPITARAETGNHLSAAREFVALLAQEDFATATAQFDDTMKAVLPEAKLREIWRALQTQVGPFRRAMEARAEQQGVYSVVFVACEFERAGLDAKVVFNREGRIAGLFFVPPNKPMVTTAKAVAPPNGVLEMEVTVGEGEWALPATLSRPSGRPPGPLPAIVLVHGSGPNDRDETVGASKPFRDLAWGLAAKGFAVLRYEKRTKTHAAKVAALPGLTVKEEVIDDALAAVSLLRSTEGIDGARIFVLGHSLGGMLAPRIARADAGIAGLIVLAGPTRPLEDLILEQSRYIFSLDGSVSDEEQARIDALQGEVDRVKTLTLADAAANISVLGVPAAYWLDLRNYDAPATARELNQPMLILQGGRDYQVRAEDFAGWERALASRKRVTLRLYRKLNHLFIAGEGRSTPAEYGKPGRVDQEVIDDIAAWIRSN